MSEMKKDKNSVVALTDGQDVQIIHCEPGSDTFDIARKAIGCDWIEIIEAKQLQKDNLVLLIDEEGKLKGNGFINCIASQLYESDRHGDVIVGSAVIVRASGDSLELLTEKDAKQIARKMINSREMSINRMAKAFHLHPQPKCRNEKHHAAEIDVADNHNIRQPCMKKETER